MPIVSTDLLYRLSGGATNTSPDLSIGGAISTTAMGAQLHNLFDLATSAETTAGHTEFRCLYLHNAHATLTLRNAFVWISSNTPNTGSSIEIGLGTSPVDGTEDAVVMDIVAPVGVTFSAPSEKSVALFVGDLPAGSHKALWIKREVLAGSGAYDDDQAILRFEGDTGA